MLYFSLPYRFRPHLLLAASCYFYMAFVPVYILILGFTIVTDYFAGILIEGSAGSKRKWMLGLSIVANISVLAVFKYYNWAALSINRIFQLMHTDTRLGMLSILLPIGLSFHTFQAMSYTIEVYRGKQKAERSFLIYSLYVMFFPQLVAGPIERPQNVIYQFFEKHDFSYRNAADGMKLIAWGLFKKMCVADNLSLTVEGVYKAPREYWGIPSLIATILFAFEIYCDFSGYSDIALGTAQVMGFRLMENFRRPYAALSVTEFWGRWHISLSTWFRDYVYIPLGGNRVSKLRYYLNIFIVFMLSGIWHGAGLNFIIWGALHGFYRVTGTASLQLRQKLSGLTGLTALPGLHRFINQLQTFILVSFAWIFFRAASFTDAKRIATHLFSGWGKQIERLQNEPDSELWLIYGGAPVYSFWAGIGCLVLLETVQAFKGEGSGRAWLAKQPKLFRWSAYYGLVLLLILFNQQRVVNFIYFRF